MLYVLNGSIAVVLFVLIFAFGVKLSKKSASKMKRGAIFPALVGLCTAVLSFLFLFSFGVVLLPRADAPRARPCRDPTIV